MTERRNNEGACMEQHRRNQLRSTSGNGGGDPELNVVATRSHNSGSRPTSRSGGASHNLRSSPSSTPAQELVRLENPRPGILRAANEYVAIPATNASSTAEKSHHQHREHCPPSTSRLTDPRDFDRPKVHQTFSTRGAAPTITVTLPKKYSNQHSSGDVFHTCNGGLGEIRPLVRVTGLTPALSSKRPLSQHDERQVRTGGVVTTQPLSINSVNTATGPQVLLPRKSSLPGGASRIGPLSVTASLPLLSVNGRALSTSSAPSNLTLASLQNSSRDVICPECGRCRCAACGEPRPLPSTWVCDDTCLLSAENVVDTVSCMCCVRGAIYHLRTDHDTGGGGRTSAVRRSASADGYDGDDPTFACGDDEAPSRWACLMLAACLLPCIWCYLPLKLCSKVVGCGYAHYHDRGCRCIRRHPNLEQQRLRRPFDDERASSCCTHRSTPSSSKVVDGVPKCSPTPARRQTKLIDIPLTIV